MAKSPQKIARPGDRLRIPAATWNRLQDELGSESGAPLLDAVARQPATEVLIRNDTATAVNQFGVLAVTAPVILPAANLPEFKRRKVFGGAAPTATAIIAVLQEPAAPAAFARAVIAGATVVKINVVNATHGYCSPTTVTTDLTSGTTGTHRVLWKAAGTGTQWGVVLLDNSDVDETHDFARVVTASPHATSANTYTAYIQNFTGTTASDGELIWVLYK